MSTPPDRPAEGQPDDRTTQLPVPPTSPSQAPSQGPHNAPTSSEQWARPGQPPGQPQRPDQQRGREQPPQGFPGAPGGRPDYASGPPPGYGPPRGPQQQGPQQQGPQQQGPQQQGPQQQRPPQQGPPQQGPPHGPQPYGGPPPFTPPRPPRTPAQKATVTVAVLAGVSVLAIVLGLTISEDGRFAWQTVHAWGVLAIVAAVLTATPLFGHTVGLTAQVARQLAAYGAAALVLYWVLFTLPAVGSNTSLLVTIGVAAGVAAAWIAPGRDTHGGQRPPQTW